MAQWWIGISSVVLWKCSKSTDWVAMELWGCKISVKETKWGRHVFQWLARLTPHSSVHSHILPVSLFLSNHLSVSVSVPLYYYIYRWIILMHGRQMNGLCTHLPWPAQIQQVRWQLDRNFFFLLSFCFVFNNLFYSSTWELFYVLYIWLLLLLLLFFLVSSCFVHFSFTVWTKSIEIDYVHTLFVVGF